MFLFSRYIRYRVGRLGARKDRREPTEDQIGP